MKPLLTKVFPICGQCDRELKLLFVKDGLLGSGDLKNSTATAVLSIFLLKIYNFVYIYDRNYNYFRIKCNSTALVVFQ